jgi:hypothetical protein
MKPGQACASREENVEHKVPLEIEERYANYRPPFDVTQIIENLVAPVPEKYLRGLRKVLLVDTRSLSRKDRVGKTWSRKRKYDKSRILGQYHYNNGASWIEIRVDRTIGQWKGKSGGLLWLSAVRHLCIGHVFDHELGHHIHRVLRPEFREKEDVADNWGTKLNVNFIRKRYWYLLPFLLPASWIVRRLRSKKISARRG